MGPLDIEALSSYQIAQDPEPTLFQRIMRYRFRLPPGDEVFGLSICVFFHCAAVAIDVVYLLGSLLPFSPISVHIYQHTVALLGYFFTLMLIFCGVVALVDFGFLCTCEWFGRSKWLTGITVLLLTALVWWPFVFERGLKTLQWNDPCSGFNQTIMLEGRSNTVSTALFPDGTTMTFYQVNGDSIFGFSDPSNETIITYNLLTSRYEIAHGGQSASGPFTWNPTLSFPGMQLFSQRNTWLADLTPVVALARDGQVLVQTGPIPYGWFLGSESEMFVCAWDANADETKTALGMILYGLAYTLQSSNDQYYGGK